MQVLFLLDFFLSKSLTNFAELAYFHLTTEYHRP